MTNAIDALSECEEKWIEVETTAVGDNGSSIEVIFRDAGTGLTEEVKKNMFNSFYTTKGSGKGTGLGLSLCQKIAERHGGSIEVKDEEHTCFRIILAG